MSLQHYAILAAVSYHKNHHLQNATTTTTSLPPHSTISSNITVVPSSVVNFLNNSNNNNITSESTITTYYGGGLGLFHQQNIRSNSYGGIDGIGSKSANSKYPNSINGNVNLLLGGAMLSLVTTILCVVCYCCHRNIKKRTEAAYRQQRQWQENDPNMEIYSVEQCYETSGLFLGESIDGLTTLSHEPPPSYDAVVAMQEQQQLLRQQQQLQLQQDELVQHNSPPPGYRSSLDVSTMVIATCSHSLPADGNMVICNSNENLNNGNNLFRQQIQNSSNHKNLATTNAIMNMKKVLNAQSCCSLQRAEVENMWNAAAAAVAARSGQIQTIVVTAADSETNMPAAAEVTSSKKTMLNYAHDVIGRHYLNQNDYRRGCPLCGKFRYDAEDESSQDSGASVDEMVAQAISTNGDMDTYNGNQSIRIASPLDNENKLLEDNECSCANHKKNSKTDELMNDATAATGEFDSNGNDINNILEMTQAQIYLNDSKIYKEDAQDDDGNFVDNNAITTISMRTTASKDTENVYAAAINCEDGAAVSTQTAAVNLDSINENGIIRLDMSKIIDKTGLPNYEAALKLESSGYV